MKNLCERENPVTKAKINSELYSEPVSGVQTELVSGSEQNEKFACRLRNHGVNEDLVCRIILEGMNAAKKDELDYGVRLRYLELAIKLLGIEQSLKKEDRFVEFIRRDYSMFSDEELEREYRERLETLRSSPFKL